MRDLLIKLAASSALVTALSGCVTEDPSLEGISFSGGNAIAHNTALQVIAPWPHNVHDTDLKTPASLGTSSTTSPTPAPQTTSVSQSPSEPPVPVDD